MDIRHEEIDRRGAFRLWDEEGVLGSMVYVRSSETTVLVQHTGTEQRARGKGAGKALFFHLVEWARETGTKVTVQCAFTRKMFQKNPDTQDVLR